MNAILSRVFVGGIDVERVTSEELCRETDARVNLTQRKLQEQDVDSTRDLLHRRLSNKANAAFAPGDIAAHSWKREQGYTLSVSSRGIRFIKYSDLYNRKARITIELDGSGHFTRAGMKADIIRDLYFAAEGHFVIRLTNEECLSALDDVINGVATLYMKRAGVPPDKQIGNFPLETHRMRIRTAGADDLVDELIEEICDLSAAKPPQQPASGSSTTDWYAYERAHREQADVAGREPPHRKIWPSLQIVRRLS